MGSITTITPALAAPHPDAELLKVMVEHAEQAGGAA